MSVSAAEVKVLREATGAGMMDCKRALQDADGDMARATEILREKGLASAAKRAGRSANQGIVDAYIHFNNTVGVLIEVNCETDFVAKTEDFQSLVKDLALHVASMQPLYVSQDEVPAAVLDAEKHIFEVQAKESGKPDNVIPKIVEGKIASYFKEVCLLDQPFVKEDSQSVGTIIDQASGKLGEKIAVRRFIRYKLGESGE